MTAYNPTIIIDELPPKAVKGDRVAIDSEWFGMEKSRLHRPHGTFALLTLTFDGKTVYAFTDPELVKPALRQVNAAIWIWMNAKFDVTQLRLLGDLRPRTEWIDIMLVEQTMFGGLYDDFSLADMARRYLDYKMEKETRSEFAEATKLTRGMIRYACIDTVVTWNIYWKQKEIIDEETLNAWRVVEKPFFWPLVSMSGILLDVPAWTALAEQNEIEVEKRVKKFAPVLPTSNQQVKAHLKKLGFSLPDVQKETLEEIAAKCKFARDILEFREYQTNASRYGKSFLRHVEADGRIYSDFHQIGAETSRMSSSNPNLQNVKKTKPYRSSFIAGPDNCFVIGDFSSQEPRILAHLSDDKNLIRIFKTGRDPYIETHRAMFNETITDKHDPRRDTIKTIFLGLDYGMSVFGLALRLGISEEDADNLIRIFFNTFPGVRDYISVKQRTRGDFVQTIMGRKIWLNKHSDQWTRNALNGPIQGSAAEETKCTCSAFSAAWGFDWSSPLVNIVHDEVVLEVPKSMAKLAVQTLGDAALEEAHRFHPEIPGKIDIVVGSNWGEK